LLACFAIGPARKLICQNYPSIPFLLLRQQHGEKKSTEWNESREESTEEGGYELIHLVEADDVGVLEQLQRGDLPLDLRRPAGSATWLAEHGSMAVCM